MKFKGQGKINMCGFEYKKNIADSRGGGGGGGGSEHPKKPVSAPAPSIPCCLPKVGLMVAELQAKYWNHEIKFPYIIINNII